MPNIDNLVGELRQLVEIDSRTKNIAEVNRAGDYLVKLLASAGLIWETVEKENAANFRIGRTTIDPTKPTILLSGHFDKVPPPCEISIDGDKIYGPGVGDMQGGNIIMVEAVRQLAANGNLTNIIVALNPEEEIGSPHHTTTMEKLAQEADYVLVFESSTEDSIYKENYLNLVSDRKGAMAWELTIKGPGGHSGTIYDPHERHSASIMAAKQILNLESLSDPKKETTINVGTISTPDGAINMLTPEVVLAGEYRTWSLEEEERVRKGLVALTSDIIASNHFTAIYRETARFAPMQATKNTKHLMDAINTVANQLGLKVEFSARRGASDGNKYMGGNQQLGIVDGFGIAGFEAHTDREFAHISSIIPTINLAAATIKAILQRG